MPIRQVTVLPILLEPPGLRGTYMLDKAEDTMQTIANYCNRYVAWGEDFRADTVA